MKLALALLACLSFSEARLNDNNTNYERELGKKKDKKAKKAAEKAAAEAAARAEEAARQAARNEFAATGACDFTDGKEFKTTGCTFEAVSSSTGCSAAELQQILGKDNEDAAIAAVNEMCSYAVNSESDSYGNYNGFPFGKVMSKGYIWDQNFFNGGTAYNSIERDDSIADQSIRIQAVADKVAGTRIIGFPDYLPNFEECQLNAAMCCYVSEKNDDFTNGDPDDSTDICHHDMSKSQRASRTQRGYSYFGGDSEGSTHCEAFAWDNETDAYKGNTLFHVAMEKNWMTEKHTRAVPGAHMCGCLEKMPVVSAAKCTETAVVQDLKIIAAIDGALSLELTNSDVTFSDCSDFAAHYEARFADDDNKDISSNIVGTCPETPSFFKDRGFTPRDTAWVPFWGKGNLSYHAMDDATVKSKINGSSSKIVKRTCLDCRDTHTYIYYRRFTDIPDNLDFMDLLLMNWFDDAGNEFNKDFKLYSTLQDAKEDKNEWTYCNFMHPEIGFPRDCGPDKRIDSQWTSLRHGGRGHVMFAYLED